MERRLAEIAEKCERERLGAGMYFLDRIPILQILLRSLSTTSLIYDIGPSK